MNEMNWGFNEWSTIATIFLSVVAIVIAIWSSRSTSMAAEKQIREIKQLSALQIDTTIKQLEVEIQKVMVDLKRSSQESEEIEKINKGAAHLGAEYKNIMMSRHQEGKAERDLQMCRDYSSSLNKILKDLKELKKKLR